MAHTVAHYLSIYRHRKSMMDAGVSHPNAQGRAAINTLVECLAALDPHQLCELSISRDPEQNERAAFIVGGKEVAVVVLPPESAQVVVARNHGESSKVAKRFPHPLPGSSRRAWPNPSLHPTRYSGLRPLPRAGELKRQAAHPAGILLPMSSAKFIVQHQLEAYNARDLSAWLTTYAPDAQQFELHGPCLAAGHAQMRERMAVRFAEPDLHAELLSRVVMGSVVVDHERITRNFPEGKGTIEMLCV